MPWTDHQTDTLTDRGAVKKGEGWRVTIGIRAGCTSHSSIGTDGHTIEFGPGAIVHDVVAVNDVYARRRELVNRDIDLTSTRLRWLEIPPQQ